MTLSSPTKSADEIIAHIGEKTKQIWSVKENPERLSELGNDLVVLQWGLGQWLVQFDDEERTAKTDMDLEEASLILDLVEKHDHKVNRAELKAKVKLGDTRRAYNQIINTVNKVKIVRADTEKVIEMLRSRISLIKGAIEREGI